jgi:ubiquinone/menaquinone biosynthesis C-methylase UbiE
MSTIKSTQIKEQVRQRYGGIAKKVREGVVESSCCGPATDCCATPDTSNEVELFDHLYADEETASLPDTATEASLGCGNPNAISELKPGETVLDLGSGGGIDCFIAAKKVGPTGHVIGLDMTSEMIDLANENKKKMGATNVEFRLGEIENMPIDSESVDVIISNCVINLSPDKDAVFAEAYRVLKPGGRLAVSDIVTEGDLPEVIRNSIEEWVGCVAGALDQEEYLQKIKDAGFEDVRVVKRTVYGTDTLQEYDLTEATRELLTNIDPNEVQGFEIVSARIVARKG